MLEIVNSWADVNATGEGGIAVGGLPERGECGQSVEGDIYFCGDAVAAKIEHFYDEAGRQVHGIEQAEQGAPRIGSGNHGFRCDFFTTC